MLVGSLCSLRAAVLCNQCAVVGEFWCDDVVITYC